MATPPPSPPEHRADALLPFAFGGTMLLSAILLFSVQPLVGKLLLPLLGGAPSVWNTVMVFFQAMLLAGYAYAHFSFRALGLRWQPLLHLVLLLLAATQLPFGFPESATLAEAGSPALDILATLTRVLGLPVFILASTAPLLQRWFACTRHTSAADPYFLYAASNLGSFGALFAYPLLVEPALRLQTQTQIWGSVFWILAGCIAGCALLSRFALRPGTRLAPEAAPRSEAATTHPPTPATVWKWIGLSFIPSSLMLGVTNYITTDVASLPLLWVIPLGLYLFTFVVAFSRHSQKAEEGTSRAVPIFALAAIFPMLVRATEPVWVFVLIHLLFFLFAALQCHLRLARLRPPPEHLTAFYLYLSLGGVLGGIFNALVAPALFDSVAEYPLMILVATLAGFPLRPGLVPSARLPAIYGGAIILLTMSIGAAMLVFAARWGDGAVNLVAAICMVACLFFRTPVRFTLALAVLLSLTAFFRSTENQVLERERNFFGVLRVVDHPEKPLRQLYHGTTIHGVQSTLPGQHCVPLSYYHPAGPVGQIDALFRRQSLPARIALVGVGAGAMAAYSQPGDHWTLYEIDPAVVRIARDTNYFTYLSHCAQGELDWEVGDARLRLHNSPQHHFGLIYIDAFSSDVIPMHLLTVEAFRLYLSRLSPNGILALHISSRHFSLEGLVANLAAEVDRLSFRSRKGTLPIAAHDAGGIDSEWVIIVPPSYSGRLEESDWRLLQPSNDAPLWTDDFSSLAGVLNL